MQATKAPFELHAADGFVLGATSFEPAGPAAGTLLVHPATATPQRFYRLFATFLAEHGVRVVTYDYRGIGRSRPRRSSGSSRSLRGYRATMNDWARLDARAAHAWVRSRFPGAPLAVLGHSFGAQLTGIIDEPREAAGAIFVGAQFAYYKNWPPLERARLAFLWHALVPAVTGTVGYLPGRLGIGEDLPAGVARQWARWCTSPEYLASEHTDANARLARFDRPTAFYSFTDDAYAPPRTVQALLDRLPPSAVDHRRVDPTDLGKGPIGHFGFFRPKMQEPLWGEALSFLTDVFAGETPRKLGKGGGMGARDFAWDVREEEILADLRYHP